MATGRTLVLLGFGDSKAGFAIDVMTARAFGSFNGSFETNGAFEVVVEEGVLGDFLGSCGLLLHILEVFEEVF